MLVRLLWSAAAVLFILIIFETAFHAAARPETISRITTKYVSCEARYGFGFEKWGIASAMVIAKAFNATAVLPWIRLHAGSGQAANNTYRVPFSILYDTKKFVTFMEAHLPVVETLPDGLDTKFIVMTPPTNISDLGPFFWNWTEYSSLLHVAAPWFIDLTKSSQYTPRYSAQWTAVRDDTVVLLFAHSPLYVSLCCSLTVAGDCAAAIVRSVDTPACCLRGGEDQAGLPHGTRVRAHSRDGRNTASEFQSRLGEIFKKPFESHTSLLILLFFFLSDVLSLDALSSMRPFSLPFLPTSLPAP